MYLMKKSYLWFVIFIMAVATISAQQAPIIFDQPEGDDSADSGYYMFSGTASYMADDFTLDSQTTIGHISVKGHTSGNPLGYISKIKFYIYADNDGEPAGNPSIPGSSVWEVSVNTYDNALNLDIGENMGMQQYPYSFVLDIEETGSSLSLETGTYWLLVAPQIPGDYHEGSPVYWFWTTTSDPKGEKAKTINPSGDFGFGTDWYTLQSINGLAFTIYGLGELGVEKHKHSQLVHYVQDNRLYLESSSEIEEMKIYNLLGQEAISRFINKRSATINLDGLSKGLYMMKVKTHDDMNSYKFIKP